MIRANESNRRGEELGVQTAGFILPKVNKNLDQFDDEHENPNSKFLGHRADNLSWVPAVLHTRQGQLEFQYEMAVHC